MKINFDKHPAIILGRWLKDRRIEKGLTLGKFAEKIAINPSIISNIELGINISKNLSTPLFNQICEALNLSLSEIEKFGHLMSHVECFKDLKMKDLFTREEIAPAFPFRLDEKTGKIVKFTKKQINEFVDHVLKDR